MFIDIIRVFVLYTYQVLDFVCLLGEETFERGDLLEIFQLASHRPILLTLLNVVLVL